MSYRPVGPSPRTSVAAVLASGLLLTGSTSTAHAQFAYPPPPAVQQFEPIEDNPYFEQDANDPRILHSKPGGRERGIDRGYIEKMARPPLENTIFIDAEFERPGVTVQPLVRPEPGTVGLANIDGATVINGNIVVVEGDSSFIGNTQNGGLSLDHNGGALQRVIGDVWTRLGDEFDFVTVFTTFEDAGAAAYYLPLQQSVTGLGECNFNTGKTFGCVFSQLQDGSTLQGFVFMNSLSYWRNWDRQMDGVVHDLLSHDHSLYPVLGQEVAHRWGSGLRFLSSSNQVSERLLGRDSAHWAGWVDSDASVMDGVDWEEQSDGTFLAVDDMKRFSTLDLYTMGALPLGKANPFYYIDNARFVPNQFVDNQAVPAELTTYLPSIEFLTERGVELEVTGNRVDLSIQDIVNAEGNRCPDPDHTQKSFKQAIVLVTRPGQTASQVASDVAALEEARVVWEDWWRENTGRRLSLCTDLGTTVCPHATASLLGGGTTGEMDPGSTFDLNVDVKADGDLVTNARLRLTLSGNGAENSTLSTTEFTIGDITAGATESIDVPIVLGEDYVCGHSLTVNATLLSDNAEEITTSYRLYPGYKEIARATFGGDDGLNFFINDDGQDSTQTGAFVEQDVFLSCDMTARTPERDFSPNDDGAFVTGVRSELSGDTSLWSDRILLDGAVDPELRVGFWLDGEGGKFSIALSDDAEAYRTVKEYEDAFHGWSVATINIADAFDGNVPERLWVRFIAEGDGVEAGVDDFLILDRAGQCVPATGALGDCGCDATGGDSLPATSAAAFILLGLFVARRRRRA